MADFASSVESSIEIANRWAIRYYKTLDSKNTDAIEQLYAPDARIAWNGTPLQVGQPLREFYTRMPSVATQVDVLDAHPLPRLPGSQDPLQVAVTATGKQSFFDPQSPEKLLNRPATAFPPGKRQTHMSEDQIEQLPRVFHQSFIISAARDQAGNVALNIEGEPVYVARSDCFRFVG